MIDRNWGMLEPQAKVHAVVRLGEATMMALDSKDLGLTLRFVGGGAGGAGAVGEARSGLVTLNKERPLREDAGTGDRHYILTGASCDGADGSAPLIDVVRRGLTGVEVSRSADAKATPLLLESVSIWCQNTDELVHLPCHEWIDDTDAVAASFAASPAELTTKRLRRAGANASRYGHWQQHVGNPPPPPGPPSLELRADPSDPSSQLLVVSCTPSAGLPARGLRWRVQCVAEERPENSPRDFLEVLRDEPGGQPAWSGDGGVLMGGARGEYRMSTHVRAGQPAGIRMGANGTPRAYLVRCAAIHPTFGEGPFSPASRYEFGRSLEVRHREPSPKPVARVHTHGTSMVSALLRDGTPMVSALLCGRTHTILCFAPS